MNTSNSHYDGFISSKNRNDVLLVQSQKSPNNAICDIIIEEFQEIKPIVGSKLYIGLEVPNGIMQGLVNEWNIPDGIEVPVIFDATTSGRGFGLGFAITPIGLFVKAKSGETLRVAWCNIEESFFHGEEHAEFMVFRFLCTRMHNAKWAYMSSALYRCWCKIIHIVNALIGEFETIEEPAKGGVFDDEEAMVLYQKTPALLSPPTIEVQQFEEELICLSHLQQQSAAETKDVSWQLFGLKSEIDNVQSHANLLAQKKVHLETEQHDCGAKIAELSAEKERCEAKLKSIEEKLSTHYLVERLFEPHDHYSLKEEKREVLAHKEEIEANLLREEELQNDISRSLEELIGIQHSSNIHLDALKAQFIKLDKQVSEAGKMTFCSVFAPAEVIKQSFILVQVFLHSSSDAKNVKRAAKEVQGSAKKRDNIPLQCLLEEGDNVEVLLNVYGKTLLMSERKIIVWNSQFAKCGFRFFVPGNIGTKEVSCEVQLAHDGVPVGELMFVTRIVSEPSVMPSHILSRQFKKVFISYAHKDEEKVRFMARAYKNMGIDCFFDRDYLKGGDVFPEVIRDFIRASDLFVLCWSKNAAESDYVRKERKLAISLAYPKVKPREKASISIYPVSMKPRAELPPDMKDVYNFEEI